jgi:hypothetical protein
VIGPFLYTPPPTIVGLVVPPRHFACRKYDACLGVAAARDWLSFSCDGCRRAPRGLTSEALDPAVVDAVTREYAARGGQRLIKIGVL